MTLIINGNDGSVGVFIKTLPTGRDGIVDVIYQPVANSFFEVVKCLFRRPTRRERNVPDGAILGPVIIGPPDEQRQILFMAQGENGSSKFLDQLGILQNKSVNLLRQQLSDELIRSQAAEEEKRSVLQGAKTTQKMIEDVKPKSQRRPPFAGKEGWGDFPGEE